MPRFRTSFGPIVISKKTYESFENLEHIPLFAAYVDDIAQTIPGFDPKRKNFIEELEKKIIISAKYEADELEKAKNIIEAGGLNPIPRGALNMDKKGNILYTDENGNTEKVKTVKA